MYFELSTAKRKRKCTICNTQIEPQEKHFIRTYFCKGVTYPIKQNICKGCASTFTEPTFIHYLKELVERLTNMKQQLNIEHQQKTVSSTGNEVPF